MLTRCGDDLFSIAVDDPADAQALAVQLRGTGRFIDVVPGIDSVVLRFAAETEAATDVRAFVEDALRAGIRPLETATGILEIPVVYGGEYGPDLESLSDAIGLTVEEIVALHTGSDYRVDMVGFTPGFAFIGGLDEKLCVPRRSEPRQQVAAGSVGIADGRTGLYAMASPGGWTLIGRTPYRLFDAAAAEPFALHAGMRVRFRSISADEFGS